MSTSSTHFTAATAIERSPEAHTEEQKERASDVQRVAARKWALLKSYARDDDLRGENEDLRPKILALCVLPRAHEQQQHTTALLLSDERNAVVKQKLLRTRQLQRSKLLSEFRENSK